MQRRISEPVRERDGQRERERMNIQRCSSESVTAEAVLHRGVWQDHVGVTEHAQSVQAERFNAKLVLQGEDPLRIETLGHG